VKIMAPTTDSPSLQRGSALPVTAPVADSIASLQRQMAALEEQLAVIGRQQAALRASLNLLLAQVLETAPQAENGVQSEPTLQRCADDIVRVLREVGRPLGTLEILDELAARHLTWRESTVRHVLADLKNDGAVREGEAGRSLSYSLARS
jgi:hypothetical protein